MTVKLRLILTWCVLWLTAGCAPGAALVEPSPPPASPAAGVQSRSLTVLAAASLTEAFQELGQMFEKSHPGIQVSFNLGGSQQLAQQLANGAPADVFASANQTQMDVAVQSGRVNPESIRPFAKNRLVVIYPQDNPGHLKELKDLAKPGHKLVLAAKEVPVGQYSLDFLAKAVKDPSFGAGYAGAVLKNVVSYEESVKAVLTKVALGEADAGIVYASDITLEAADQVRTIVIPDALNVVASYPIAVIQDSRSPELAGAFVELVLSPEGQQVLAKYGFIPVVSR